MLPRMRVLSKALSGFVSASIGGLYLQISTEMSRRSTNLSHLDKKGKTRTSCLSSLLLSGEETTKLSSPQDIRREILENFERVFSLFSNIFVPFSFFPSRTGMLFALFRSENREEGCSETPHYHTIIPCFTRGRTTSEFPHQRGNTKELWQSVSLHSLPTSYLNRRHWGMPTVFALGHYQEISWGKYLPWEGGRFARCRPEACAPGISLFPHRRGQ